MDTLQAIIENKEYQDLESLKRLKLEFYDLITLVQNRISINKNGANVLDQLSAKAKRFSDTVYEIQKKQNAFSINIFQKVCIN